MLSGGFPNKERILRQYQKTVLPLNFSNFLGCFLHHLGLFKMRDLKSRSSEETISFKSLTITDEDVSLMICYCSSSRQVSVWVFFCTDGAEVP